MFLIDPYRFNTAPASVPDPYWASTNLLVHADALIPSATIEDFSAYNADGTVISGAIVDATVTKWGAGSLYFDGTGRGVTFTNPSPFTRFDLNTPATWECWMMEESGSGGGILSHRTSGTQGYAWTSYGVRGYIDSSWREGFLSWTRPSYDVWHHMVWMTTGTVGGNAMYAFIDGVLVASSAFGTIQTVTNSNFQLGSQDSFGEAAFKGWLDDIRFTRGVARYSTGGFTPPAGPFANSAP